MFPRVRSAALVLSVLMAAGCDDEVVCLLDTECPSGQVCSDQVCVANTLDAGVRLDASVRLDAATPAGEDAAIPTGQDAAMPAGEDAATPAGEDAATLAGEDAATPAGEDAATPAGEDAATPAGEDAATPAGEDAGTTMLAGEQCSNAEVVASSASLTLSSAGYANDFSGGTGCVGTEGPDRMFQVSLSPGQRVVASVRSATSFDPSINLVVGTAASCVGTVVCASAEDSGSASTANVVAFANLGAGTVSVFLIVDSSSPTTQGGEFTLDILIEQIATGDNCSSATKLTSGTPLAGESTAGFVNDFEGGTNCATTNVSEGDRVYSFIVPNGQRATVTVTPAASFNTSLSLVSGPALNCHIAPLECLTSSNNGAAGAADVAIWTNNSGAEQEVFAIVDSAVPAGGVFAIGVVIGTPPAVGDRCQAPTVLTAGHVLAGETTVNFTNDYSGSGTGCSSANGGPDHVYSLVVPAGRRALVTVTPDAGFDTSLSLIAGAASACDAVPRVCVANSNSGNAGVADVARYTNTGSADQTVFVIVDSAAIAGGGFSIGAAFETPTAGDMCQGAIALTSGAALTGQTTVGYSNDYSGAGTGCLTGAGPDRVYSLVVPAGQQAVLTVTPDAGFDTSVSLIAGSASACDAVPRVCVSSSNSGSTGVADVARYTNTGSADQTLFVIVDSTSTTGGGFGIAALVQAPPAGDYCGNAEAIVIGTTPLPISRTTVGFTNDYAGGTNCAAGYGPDRVFVVTLDAGKRLTATLTPTGFDANLSLIEGAANCGATPPVCLVGKDQESGFGAETAVYTNETASAKTLYIVADGYSVSSSGVFTLNVVVDVPPSTLAAADTCATAPALTSGQTVAGSTAGLTGNYGAGTNCSGVYGIDGVYSIVVPKGLRVRATVVPTTSWDPSISLVGGPATNCNTTPRVCLTGSDSGLSGASETAVYVNNSAAAMTIFVVIDSYSAGSTGPFELTAIVEAQPVGENCVNAEPLTLSAGACTLNGQTTVGYVSDYGIGAKCVGTAGADRVYSVTVPGNHRISATVTPTSSWNPSINLVLDPFFFCGWPPRECLAGSDTGGVGAPDTVAANIMDPGFEVYVIVESLDVRGMGPFDLAVSVAPIPPPAPQGDPCGTPVQLTGSVSLAGETNTGMAKDCNPAISCTGYGNAGADKVYLITVAPGQTLEASVTGEGTTGDPAIYLVGGLSPSSNCFDGSDEGSGPNIVTYTNSGATPKEIFIVVDSMSSTATFNFSLEVTLTP